MSRGDRLATLERWQSALLVVVGAIWVCVVFSSSYSPDPDGYYHVGVARRLIEDGWLRTFDWLPYTTIADPYPDVHFVEHLVLVPIVAVFGVDVGLRVGVLVLSSALAVSLCLVLRRRGVRWPIVWVALGTVAVPILLVYSIYLKGASAFVVVLVWFVDAVWSRAHRRTFVLAALSVFTYVGAPVLVPFVVVHVLVVRVWERRWELASLGATVLGLVGAMLVNPFWPAHWSHVGAELASIFQRDPALIPGVFRGAEWNMLRAADLLVFSGAALAGWGLVLIRQLGGGARVPAHAATATICALGLLGGSLLAGSKLLHLFALFSVLGAPMVLTALGAWPHWLRSTAVAAALALGAWNVVEVQRGMSLPAVRADDYRVMARWLDERTAPNEVVITAWDDFPGLFAFGGDQRYVAGINVQFLRDHDRKRFDAYALLFSGMVEDPEALLPMFFDDARLIVVRRQPRHPGELALTERLAANPHFQEVAGPVHAWRVFERKHDVLRRSE